MPNDVISWQLHYSGTGVCSWTTTRDNIYGVSGIPHTQFDGVLEAVGVYGTDLATYNWYVGKVNTRLGVPTDVTIDLALVPMGGSVMHVSATVGIEAGGVDKDMEIHFVRARDYFPSSADNRYRNCVRQHNQTTASVTAGNSAVVESGDFNLDGAGDERFIVVAQEIGGSHEIYQAAYIDIPPPVEGDVDGDGDVDLSDLAALLASFGTSEGDPDFNPAADLSGDGRVDLVDLAVLLAQFGVGT